MSRFLLLSRGDPAPWFRQRSASNPLFAFDTTAGRYIVLLFFVTTTNAEAQTALATMQAATHIFDDKHTSFFGISNDPGDAAKLTDQIPGRRFILDFDRSVARAYGAAAEDGNHWRRLWVVLDPSLRILEITPFSERSAEDMIAYLAQLPAPVAHGGFEMGAPILHLPNVFEPQFCEELIAYYAAHGGEESGFMRERNGMTVLMHDHVHKRRRDCIIEDENLRNSAQKWIVRRIIPEIAKAHQFHATRMERYLIGCYSAEDGGHFRAHRDNTTAGTAHRRFAVSINLNADFEGGEIAFPEFSMRGYRPAPGAAIVFSCSLLHQVSKVTAGKRLAFLPFLYDEAAAAIRDSNRKFLEPPSGA